MGSEDKITTWKGKNTRDMSKEELIDALSQMSKMYLSQIEQGKRERDFIFSLHR